MLPIVEVEIDEDVLIKCPLKDFAYRKAAVVCPQCAGFMGIGQLPIKPALPSGATDEEKKTYSAKQEKYLELVDHLRWDKKYIIRCAAMIERRTTIIEVVE